MRKRAENEKQDVGWNQITAARRTNCNEEGQNETQRDTIETIDKEFRRSPGSPLSRLLYLIILNAPVSVSRNSDRYQYGDSQSGVSSSSYQSRVGLLWKGSSCSAIRELFQTLE
jgi:hypothetical protein